MLTNTYSQHMFLGPCQGPKQVIVWQSVSNFNHWATENPTLRELHKISWRVGKCKFETLKYFGRTTKLTLIYRKTVWGLKTITKHKVQAVAIATVTWLASTVVTIHLYVNSKEFKNHVFFFFTRYKLNGKSISQFLKNL